MPTVRLLDVAGMENAVTVGGVATVALNRPVSVPAKITGSTVAAALRLILMVLKFVPVNPVLAQGIQGILQKQQ